ncbi:TIGR00730 family Rossman fold protein [Paraburkholderia sp. JHI2823]|uniref:LOG family protein n=1 Tax=Paraburkholderia TaxID=1822464 RepID=UPI0004897AB8|nr:TIGR00730 family Rossman fold protein [Paraburkholderia mimosarum]
MSIKETNTDTIRAVCVYCGSSPGNNAAYVEAGEQLGRALAASGLALIYGGGTSGVMGAVARGTLNVRGQVSAIIPRFLLNRESTMDALTMLEDLTITETMHERKQKMFERADAFVVLPGGIGTVDETMEIMTWCQLGRHRKPMVLVNVKRFWDPMLTMLDHMRRAGFIHSGHLLQPIVVDRVDDVIPAIVAAAPAAAYRRSLLQP